MRILVCDAGPARQKQLTGVVREALAYLGIADIQADFVTALPARFDGVLTYNAVLLYASATYRQSLEFALGMRQAGCQASIVFVVEGALDLSQYVRPAVRASGLLFIPLNRERVAQVLSELHEQAAAAPAGETFSIKSEGEHYLLDAGSISFFEASGKKIAVKTGAQQISFYGTLKETIDALPPYFIRCHKGFVVNIRKITKVNLSDMTICLNDGCSIPLSRSYRDEVKAVLRNAEANQ